MKVKNLKLRNIGIIIPYDGNVILDENGCAEVSNKAAKLLLQNSTQWVLPTGEQMPDENESGGNDPEGGEGDPTPDEIIAGIKALTLEEAKAAAKEAKYPVEEWEKLKSKGLLTAYLVKKYKETLDPEGGE